MKKSLITLMALSCVAMGDTTLTLDDAAKAVAGNTGYNTEGGKFTVALTLDVDALRTLLEKGQTKSWGTNIINYVANGTDTGVTLNGGSDSQNKITSSGLYARWGTDTAWNPTGGSDIRWDGGTDLATLGWDSIEYAGLVYSFDKNGGTGTTVAFTLINNEGTAIVDSYVKASGLTSSNAGVAALTFDSSVLSSYYFNELKGEADMKALAGLAAKAAPLPEPTTATLSLLALAGLAARRRRK